MEKWDFWEIKEKKDQMRWMNGISCVNCHMEARTFVVEQDWEISILSQLRTELMCHLA